MKKFTFLFCLIAISQLQAQTWNGNTSTDWNTPANWSGNAVPLPAGNVTIPTAPAGNRFPILAGNITINGLTMQTGSQLNINGYTITLVAIDLHGTISNSSGSTDISITLTGAATSYIRNASFTDHVVFNINGTGVFYDSYSGGTANSYSGNVSYQRNGAGDTYIGLYDRNQYGGNVTISCTVAATLSAFESGAGITGNFSCSHVGGALTIGNVGASTNIGGTLNITASGSGGAGINRLINQIQGGNITLQDRAGTSIFRDTIKVNAISITGQTGALDLNYNDLTGNLNFTGAASLSATSYVRNSIVTGTASYTHNGTGVFYDSYSGGTANSYSGNVSYQRNGAGDTYIGLYDRNQYGGNVTISCTVAATLSAFESGAGITGNFSCSHVGGALTIGYVGASTNIGGTLNIMASGSGGAGINRLINQIQGGNITLQDRAGTSIFRDTIKVNAISITGQTGALDFNYNDLTGNLNFTGAASLSATSYVRNSIVTGTASYTHNGTGVFYDSYSGGTANSYSGNVSYQRNGAGDTYIGLYDRNQYGGNVTISCTVAATLSAFESGAGITGNFSCSHVGGALTIGNVGASTNIGGTLNIMASGSGGAGINRLINQIQGGNITLQDRAGTSIFRDTIKVNAISITGQTGALDFNYNDLTGNLNFTGSKSLSATSYVRNSIMTGNASYTLKGTGVFYDTYSGGTKNNYGGNVSYLRDSSGPLYVGYYDTVSIAGNLTFKYSLPGAVDNRYLAFVGNGNSTISQEGTIPLQFERLSMKKTGGGSLTLMDSVRINDQVYFSGGNIISANQKELIWLNTALSIIPSDISHVVGPVVKIGSQVFRFPVGSNTAMQTVAMTAPVGATSRFRAEYFPMNPHPAYDTSKRVVGLAAVSACEYWKVDREEGATNITLTFDFGGPCLCVEQPANLRVARWSGTQWADLGNGGFTGGLSDGTIQTAAGVTDYGVFTLGSSAVVGPSVSIARDVANPVCVCRRVTFTATPGTAGCGPSYQWKKNGVNVGTNSNIYSDSTLVNGDVITVVIGSSAAFSWPPTATSNSFSITTTDINTWAGTTSNNWHLANNWSCQSIPCELSKVTVNPAPNPCEILSGQVKVISLTANDGSVFRALNGTTLQLK